MPPPTRTKPSPGTADQSSVSSTSVNPAAVRRAAVVAAAWNGDGDPSRKARRSSIVALVIGVRCSRPVME
jgi:hypothetical protein